MARLTVKMLDMQLDNLNSVSHRKYTMEKAYGGYKLYNKSQSKEITARLTAREMYHVLRALRQYKSNGC